MIDFGRYIIGLLLCAVCFGPIVLGSARLRARAVPGWTGPSARVAEAIIGLGLVVVALQVVGVIGLFDRAGAVCACAAAGTLAWVGAGRIPASRGVVRRTGAESSGPSRFELVLVSAGVALVAAAWGGWTFSAYRHGMSTVDTIWYHLPQAARFVQLGNTLHLQYFDGGAVTVFYPANAELLHALGLLLFGNDLLSPAINLGWAALACLAGWAIGRPFGRERHCLLAVLLLLGTPGLVDTQPGGAYNDIVCVTLLLCAAAMLVNGGVKPSASALAAVAGGLALGTKFTMIIPVIALGVGVVAITDRGGRMRQVGIWVTGLLLLGGYWYVRNAALVGNPLPSLALHLGPFSLPAPYENTRNFTVAQYLTNGHVWTTFFLPGLRQSLGPGWWLITALAVAGSLIALLTRGDRVLRVLGAVAVVSGVAFLFSPQALGLPGAPFYFVYNVRYAAPPLALGLVLVAARMRRGQVFLVLAALVLVATAIDPGVWPTGVGWKPFAPSLHGNAAIAGLIVGILAFILVATVSWTRADRRELRPALLRSRVLGAAALAAALCFAAAGWAVDSSYARARYRATQPLPQIYAWARGIRHSRIGIAGFFLQYPLYGPDSSNYVQYIGTPGPHRGFAPVSDCHTWRRLVDAGHYRWLVTAGAPMTTWTLSSPQAEPVIVERPPGHFPADTVILFRVRGPLDPSTCPA